MKARHLARAAARLTKRAGGPIEVAIVLGSGLAEGFRDRIDGAEIPYAKLHAPASALAGHPGVAYAGTYAGKRVVAFAGRAHLYQGHTPAAVTYFVRLAAAAGARIAILTNAAGGLNPDFRRGDLMLIRDHINLTGMSPLDGNLPNPFLSMTDAYAERLRIIAREFSPHVTLHEGVYAGLRGPQYETPAECEAIRRMGADVVGMSTVLETIAARSLGLEVLGISLVTNETGPAAPVSHEDVLDASRDAAERVAMLVNAVVRMV